MTIASETSKVSYNGNGSTTRFAIPFPFLRQADIKVLLRGKDGAEASLVQSTHYGLEEEIAGGTCVMNTAPESGQTLIIKRDPAIVQETVYEEGVPLSAKAREDALDLVTMICQANRERVDRAVKFSPTSQSGEVTMPEPQGGRAIVWNEDGSGLENGPTVLGIESAASDAASAAAAKAAAETARDQAQAAQTAAQEACDQIEAVAGSKADGVEYVNATSGLTATNVQSALDELAYDTEALSGLGRQMGLGFFQLMSSQSMSGMELTDRVLHTFEDTSGINANVSSGYVHDSVQNLLKPASSNGDVTLDFGNPAGYVQEDVKESIAVFVVDTANTSGHFTNGTDNLKLVGTQNVTNACTGGTAIASAGPPGKFFDGSTDGVWGGGLASSAQADLPWAGYTWPSPKRVWMIRYYNSKVTDTVYFPAEAVMDITNDNGRTWTELASIPCSGMGWKEYELPEPTTMDGFRLRVKTPTSAYGGAYEWRLGEIEAFDMTEADVAKVVPGTRVITDGGEVVITGVTNNGDGPGEVSFSGTLGVGTHAVIEILGTEIVDGRVRLKSYPSGEAVIDRNEGSPIGDMTFNGGLGAAFDGVLSQSYGSSARGPQSGEGTYYVGRDFGEGSARMVSKAVVYACSDRGGFTYNTGQISRLTLQGSNDNATWTELATTGDFVATAGEVKMLTVAEPRKAYRYVRLAVYHNGADYVFIAELQFFEQEMGFPVGVPYTVASGDIPAWSWIDINSISASEALPQPAKGEEVGGDTNYSTSQVVSTGSTYTKLGQAVALVEHSVWSIVMRLGKQGSPTGDVTFNIHAASGTPGTDAIPSGAPLASKTVDVASIPATEGDYEVVFDSPVAVEAGDYVFTVEYSGGDASNGLLVGTWDQGATPTGNASGFNGSWEATPGTIYGLRCTVYGTVIPPEVDLLYALSFDSGASWRSGANLDIVTYPCPSDGAGWMTGTELVGLTGSTLPAPSDNLRVAVALKTNHASVSPEVDAITINVNSEPEGMTLQLHPLETTGIPAKATVLAVVNSLDGMVLNTDLTAEVSRNGGTDWQAVPMAKVADFLAGRIVMEGKAEFSHADGGNAEALLRLKSGAGRPVELHYASLGVVV